MGDSAITVHTGRCVSKRSGLLGKPHCTARCHYRPLIRAIAHFVRSHALHRFARFSPIETLDTHAPETSILTRHPAAPTLGALRFPSQGKQQPFSSADEREVRPFPDDARRSPERGFKNTQALSCGNEFRCCASRALPITRRCGVAATAIRLTTS